MTSNVIEQHMNKFVFVIVLHIKNITTCSSFYKYIPFVKKMLIKFNSYTLNNIYSFTIRAVCFGLASRSGNGVQAERRCKHIAPSFCSRMVHCVTCKTMFLKFHLLTEHLNKGKLLVDILEQN